MTREDRATAARRALNAQRVGIDAGASRVAEQVADAQRILVVGHAHGRSNMAKGFIEHVKHNHHLVAERVIGEIAADLSALTVGPLVME